MNCHVVCCSRCFLGPWSGEGQRADFREKVATFPQIDVTDSGEMGLNDAQKLHRSVIQGG